jgi:hypothetical protein
MPAVALSINDRGKINRAAVSAKSIVPLAAATRDSQ